MKKVLALLFVLLLVGVSCVSFVPVIISFDANPALITAGGSTTLVWNVTGADSVTIDQGLGVLPPAGSRSVSPTVTTVYTLSASNALGTVSKAVIVNVNPAPIVINVSINPATIISGGFATLMWDVSGANSASFDQGIGSVPLSGNRLISPTVTTTYTLTASGAGGTLSRSVVLTVNPPIVATFSVNPSAINVGQSSTLQWNVTGADSVSIDQGIGEVSPTGSRVVMPYSTTTYNLTATSSCCAVNKSAVLSVGRAYPYGYPFGYPYDYPYRYPYGYPFIDIFNGTPGTIAVGGSATLQWYVTGAASVYITGIGNVSSSGSVIVTPSTTTTYVLIASNYYGSRSASVTIRVQ